MSVAALLFAIAGTGLWGALRHRRRGANRAEFGLVEEHKRAMRAVAPPSERERGSET